MFTSRDVSLGAPSSRQRALAGGGAPAAAPPGPDGSTTVRFPLRLNVILAGRPSSLASGAGTVAR